MTTLDDALAMTSWRWLLVIGRRRGLRFSSNILKATLVDRLSQILPNSDNLNATLADLSEAEQHALADLLVTGGRLPLRYLRPRHGDLRSIHVLQRDRPSLSPLERLFSRGLVFYDRATDDVFIPADIIPRLPPLAQPAPPTVTPPWQADEPAPWPAWRPVLARASGPGSQGGLLAAHDLACLHRPGTGLALLQAERVFRVDRIRSVVKVRVGSRQ